MDEVGFALRCVAYVACQGMGKGVLRIFWGFLVGGLEGFGGMGFMAFYLTRFLYVYVYMYTGMYVCAGCRCNTQIGEVLC